MAAFGKRLRQLREEKGMTREALSGETGFDPSYLGKVERAEVNCSISHVATIAKALKLPASTLFEFD